jgi:hypothetical protein
MHRLLWLSLAMPLFVALFFEAGRRVGFCRQWSSEGDS